jgi:dipeptidyl aminopeptidase/acylaminoacyl peptidase
MHVLDLRTGKTTRAGVEGLSPDWSRDGRIALVGPTSWPGPIGSISVRRIDGSKATERALVTGTDGHDSSPSWSPDGQRLVFATRRRGESTISIIDSDSSQRQLLARHAASPAWSPDGSAIAYRTPRGAWYRPWPEVSWQPITIGDDGTGRRQITQTDLKDMKQTWNTTLDVLGPPASSPLGAALRNLDKLEGAQSPTGPDVATYRRGIWLGRNGKRIHDQVAAARTYARERHLPMVVKIPQDAKVKVPRKAITGRR